ncbi:MAG TPA: DUF3237 domain-containing protein [Sphingobium sp.]|uniref:DUF3237 domain-containing protein n=1 Tax=Sphingobium sp. TaxID=1912891 RepID=UPI002ED64BEF
MLDLKLLCTVDVEVAPPLAVGKTPGGNRSISELRSVIVTSERVNARLAGAAAADWILVKGKVGDVDVRMTVRTDDDALIYVTYTGKLDLARAGGPVVTVAPTFETGDERYAWLNDIQAIGRGILTVGAGGSARIDYTFYEVL